MNSQWDDPDDEIPLDDQPEPGDEFPADGTGALATIGQRGSARSIDFLIAVMGPAALALYVSAESDGGEVRIQHPLVVALAVFGIAGLYEVALIALRGQTVGKALLGIRVGSFSDGANPPWGRSFVRYLIPTALFAIPFALAQLAWLVVYLSAIPNPRHQGWHDRAANTVVVRVR